jgi:hypothetical protein
VVRFGSGYAAAPLESFPGVAFYDAHGSVAKVLGGRSGFGPKELTDPFSILRGRNDTLFILDRRNTRLSVIDPDSTISRTIPLPRTRVNDIKQDSAGQLYIMGPLHQGIEMGPPVHLIDRLGVVTSSVGTPMGPTPSSSKWWKGHKPFDVWRDGTIAVAEHDRFTISVYEPNRGTKVIQRRVPWFTPWDTLLTIGQSPAAINSIWIDKNHRLWVAITVIIAGADRVPSDDHEYARKVADTIVEVIDIDSNAVLARRRFDTPSTIHGGILVGIVSDTVGNTYARVGQLRLTTNGDSQ